jgi:ribosomal protein L18
MNKLYELRQRRKTRRQYKLTKINRNEKKLKLCVFVSNKHMQVQLIAKDKTLSVFSTQQKDFKSGCTEGMSGYNVAGIELAAKLAANMFNQVLEKEKNNYTGIYVDTCGKSYIGRVSKLIDALRLHIKGWSF